MIKPFEKPIYVTRPFLPPIEEYVDGLREIWENQWLSNSGPLHQRFARQMAEAIQTDNLCLFNNGTLALQIGLQGMGISGEVITTPFTFAATAHALHWNNITPVFADIEPEYYTLDPDAVEAAITPRTSAILAVHVYGFPCKLEALAHIAKRHNLALIYDAAHAFGVEVDGQSIAHQGDLSMFSFHATKLFHSIEGGMLTCKDPNLKQTFDSLKNFGFTSETDIAMPGTNAKMNEMQALMGSLVLKRLPWLIEESKKISETYRECLKDVPGIKFPPPMPDNVKHNYIYQPVEIDQEAFGMSRDALCAALKTYNIHARRYFYPLLSDLACYKNLPSIDPLQTAQQIAQRVLCLPIYAGLTADDVVRISEAIQQVQNCFMSSCRKLG